MLLAACNGEETVNPSDPPDGGPSNPPAHPEGGGDACGAPELGSGSLSGVSCEDLVIEGTNLSCGSPRVTFDGVAAEVMGVASGAITVRVPAHEAQADAVVRVETDFGSVEGAVDVEGSSCGGAFLWDLGFGAPQYQAARDVAHDSAGNLYVVGAYSGSVDFGGGPRLEAAPGDSHGFVLKLDPEGGYLWDKVFPESPAQSVAVDSHDDVIVAFDGDTTLAKLDGEGEIQWVKALPLVEASAIAVGADDSIAVTGGFYVETSFGGETFPAPGGYADMFVAKFATDGTHLWSNPYGDSVEMPYPHRRPQTGRAIVIDAAGTIVVGAEISGEVDFGEGRLEADPDGWSDVAFAGFSPDGEHLWSNIRVGAGPDHIVDLVAMESGVVAVGTFDPHTSFDAGDDVFVIRFDALGQQNWKKIFGTPNTRQEAAGAARDADGIVITGNYLGQIGFGGAVFESQQWTSMFVARLDGDGGHTYSASFPTESSDHYAVFGEAVTIGEAGPIVVGEYFGSVDFGGGALPLTGPDDSANLFVLALVR